MIYGAKDEAHNDAVVLKAIWKTSKSPMNKASFTLHPLPPFRLDYTVWALRRRPNNLIDCWDGRDYSRVLLCASQPIKMTLRQKGTRENPRLLIVAQSNRQITPLCQQTIHNFLNNMLGLTVDLQPFYTRFQTDSIIYPLAARFLGLKPSQFPTLFESLINAVACQQVSLAVGITLLNRLAQTYGRKLQSDTTVFTAFPRAEDIAEASEEEIQSLGFSHQKARTIRELADAQVAGVIKRSQLETKSEVDCSAFLQTFRGIGRWSAEYVLLRGLGRLVVFPGDDVGAQRNVQKLLALDHKPSYDEIKQLTARYSPYSGLIYFHLLLQKLTAKGVV